MPSLLINDYRCNDPLKAADACFAMRHANTVAKDELSGASTVRRLNTDRLPCPTLHLHGFLGGHVPTSLAAERMNPPVLN